MFARRLIVAIGVLALAAIPVGAQTWAPTAGGTYSWTDVPNWDTGVPNSATAAANVNIDIAGDQTIELNQLIDLQSLTLGDGNATSPSNLTIAAGTGGSLQFNGAATLTGTANGVKTISAPIALLGGLTISQTGGSAFMNITGGISTGTGAGAQTLTFSTSGDSTGALDRGINIASPITGDGNVVKMGGNFINFTAANTYTGTTTINGGAIRLSGAGTLGSGNLILNGGQFFPGASFTRAVGTGADQVQWTGNVPLGAIDTPLTVNLGGAGAGVTWGVGGFLTPTGILGLSTLSSNNTVTFVNAIDLNGAVRTVEVLNGSAAIDAVISGVISGGPGSGLTKTQTGTLELTGANTYTGPTTINGGAIRLTGAGTIGGGNLTLSGGQFFPGATFTRAVGTGDGEVQLTTGNTGFGTIGQDLTVNLGGAGGTITWGTTGTTTFSPARLVLGSTNSDGTVFFVNPIDTNGAAREVRADNGSAAVDAVVSGAISGTGGFTAGGDGTLVVSGTNTYTGETLVGANGVLRVQSADGLGGTGAGGHTRILGGIRQNRVELSGGISVAETIQIEGRTAITNLSPALSSFSGTNTLTGNITFNASGVEYGFHVNTGAGFTIAGNITNTLGSGTNIRNVNLLGEGTGTITGVVSNGPANDPIAIIKRENGTWTLAGANTYAGATTINAGTLRYNGTLSAGSAGVTVNTGGTLAGTGTINRAVTVASGGTLAPGAGGAGVLTVANSSGTAVDLQSGANFGVRITGGLPSGTAGGSTDSVVSPTTNSVLNVTAGSVTIDPAANIVVDGTGMSFTLGQPYSYQVGATGTDLSALSITDPARFQFLGFAADSPSLTGNSSGAIFLAFTPVPVPEPGMVLLTAAVGLGLVGRWRARRLAGTRIA